MKHIIIAEMELPLKFHFYAQQMFLNYYVGTLLWDLMARM